MLQMSEKRLVLFFTRGMSLDKWQEIGHLSRELTIYKKLASFLKVAFLTYGTDERFANSSEVLPIQVLPNKWNIRSKLYSIIAPFLHQRALKEANFYKTNQMNGAWTAVLAKLLFRKKLIVKTGYQWSLNFARENDDKFKKTLIYLVELISYRYADKVTVTSQEAKRHVIEAYKVQPEKISLIPNYIDTDLFKPIKINRSDAKIRLCFVGRLVECKNLFSLIDAVKDLEIQLTIIGDGPLRKELEARSNALGINVVFKGIIPNNEVPIELNHADIFIQPSLYEGNPKTLLEAMACRLAVIGTDVPGINEIITYGENGLLCETSAESIREAIQTLLNNKELRTNLGKNAAEYIRQNFSLDVLIKREVKLLEELV